MSKINLPVACVLVFLLGLFAAGCEEPLAEGGFDNIYDPYGTTYTPDSPWMGTPRQVDSVSVNVVVYRADKYATSVIIERRDQNSSDFKPIATVLLPGLSFVDTTGIRVGMTYYYRGRAMAQNGNASAYSNVVYVRMVQLIGSIAPASDSQTQ